MKNKQIIILLIISIILINHANTEDRFALLIGNANYQNIGKLNNPINDVNDVAIKLKLLGFNVTVLTDSNLEKMEEEVEIFGGKLSTNKDNIGLFFYSGHGIQANGINYLIPTNAEIRSEQYLKTKALAVQSILDVLNTAGNHLNVIILDACRDNPFSWNRSSFRGLSVINNQPPGSIIVYSTSAGSVAQDGDGRNSTFTDALLKTIMMQNVEIKEVFNKIGSIVQKETNSLQVPAIYNQYFDSYYLAGQVDDKKEKGNDESIIGEMITRKKTGSLKISSEESIKIFIDGIIKGSIAVEEEGIINNIIVGEHNVTALYDDGKMDNQKIEIVQDTQSIVTFKRNIKEGNNNYPRNGLVSEFLFNNNTKDSGEKGYPNNPYNVIYTVGKIGEAAKFDGSKRYIELHGEIAQVFANRNPYTVCVWTKNVITERIICGTNGYYTTAFSLWGGPDFAIDRGNANDGELFRSNNKYNDGNWYFVVCSYNNGVIKMKIFSENKLIEDNSYLSRIDNAFSSTENGYLCISRFGKSQIGYYNGIIDQLRIYNRELTDNEINTLWNNGQGIE